MARNNEGKNNIGWRRKCVWQLAVLNSRNTISGTLHKDVLESVWTSVWVVTDLTFQGLVDEASRVKVTCLYVQVYHLWQLHQVLDTKCKFVLSTEVHKMLVRSRVVVGLTQGAISVSEHLWLLFRMADSTEQDQLLLKHQPSMPLSVWGLVAMS